MDLKIVITILVIIAAVILFSCLIEHLLYSPFTKHTDINVTNKTLAEGMCNMNKVTPKGIKTCKENCMGYVFSQGKCYRVKSGSKPEFSMGSAYFEKI